MKLKFKDLPIIVKLYLCIVVFIILPLILVGFYLNNRFAEITLNKASESALQTLKQTWQNFNTLVEDTNDISLRILSNDNVQHFLKGDFENLAEYEQNYLEVDSYLDDIIGSKRYYDAVQLYSDQGLVYQRGVQVQEMSQEEKGIADALQGRSFWATSSNGISYYRAIMDFDKLGRTIGYEKFTINEETLYDFYRNMNSTEGSFIFLLDQTGLVLSTPSIRVVKKPS